MINLNFIDLSLWMVEVGVSFMPLQPLSFKVFNRVKSEVGRIPVTLHSIKDLESYEIRHFNYSPLKLILSERLL